MRESGYYAGVALTGESISCETFCTVMVTLSVYLLKTISATLYIPVITPVPALTRLQSILDLKFPSVFVLVT